MNWRKNIWATPRPQRSAEPPRPPPPQEQQRLVAHPESSAHHNKAPSRGVRVSRIRVLAILVMTCIGFWMGSSILHFKTRTLPVKLTSTDVSPAQRLSTYGRDDGGHDVYAGLAEDADGQAHSSGLPAHDLGEQALEDSSIAWAVPDGSSSDDEHGLASEDMDAAYGTPAAVSVARPAGSQGRPGQRWKPPRPTSLGRGPEATSPIRPATIPIPTVGANRQQPGGLVGSGASWLPGGGTATTMATTMATSRYARFRDTSPPQPRSATALPGAGVSLSASTAASSPLDPAATSVGYQRPALTTLSNDGTPRSVPPRDVRPPTGSGASPGDMGMVTRVGTGVATSRATPPPGSAGISPPASSPPASSLRFWKVRLEPEDPGADAVTWADPFTVRPQAGHHVASGDGGYSDPAGAGGDGREDDGGESEETLGQVIRGRGRAGINTDGGGGASRSGADEGAPHIHDAAGSLPTAGGSRAGSSSSTSSRLERATVVGNPGSGAVGNPIIEAGSTGGGVGEGEDAGASWADPFTQVPRQGRHGDVGQQEDEGEEAREEGGAASLRESFDQGIRGGGHGGGVAGDRRYGDAGGAGNGGDALRGGATSTSTGPGERYGGQVASSDGRQDGADDVDSARASSSVGNQWGAGDGHAQDDGRGQQGGTGWTPTQEQEQGGTAADELFTPHDASADPPFPLEQFQLVRWTYAGGPRGGTVGTLPDTGADDPAWSVRVTYPVFVGAGTRLLSWVAAAEGGGVGTPAYAAPRKEDMHLPHDHGHQCCPAAAFVSGQPGAGSRGDDISGFVPRGSEDPHSLDPRHAARDWGGGGLERPNNSERRRVGAPPWAVAGDRSIGGFREAVARLLPEGKPPGTQGGSSPASQGGGTAGGGTSMPWVDDGVDDVLAAAMAGVGRRGGRGGASMGNEGAGQLAGGVPQDLGAVSDAFLRPRGKGKQQKKEGDMVAVGGQLPAVDPVGPSALGGVGSARGVGVQGNEDKSSVSALRRRAEEDMRNVQKLLAHEQGGHHSSAGRRQRAHSSLEAAVSSVVNKPGGHVAMHHSMLHTARHLHPVVMMRGHPGGGRRRRGQQG
eukprot:jgi/Mesvir1/4250/Mv22218-RA.1